MSRRNNETLLRMVRDARSAFAQSGLRMKVGGDEYILSALNYHNGHVLLQDLEKALDTGSTIEEAQTLKALLKVKAFIEGLTTIGGNSDRIQQVSVEYIDKLILEEAQTK